ncbi:lignin-forming anionic peroxidase [Ziziphus jujuba]|uniref:Peroxidase n=2 Tax=Ziziphus jujuba TaxID=326968 RepID=A0A6P4BAL6_ZIZJJ|nr:lignin-forming anionic peroxidase [Ziziphus jujuba]KAH7516730.1 hypothetical protein FEM48_Zijuj10G0165900 [Ziziphus jujuba var. spinosa]
MASRAFVPSVLLLLAFFSSTCTAQLSPSFYNTTCPNALNTIRTTIRNSISTERRMAASLIRLHFHDCFVKGCDGSILLNETPTLKSEKNTLANKDSARGYDVIEAAKSAVEKICPGVVSCADVLAVAARDASVAVGGPTWTVKLGRRDSTAAYPDIANSDLPRFTDSLNTLVSRFGGKGLSERDMVALSGSHSIGQAQCFTFRGRIYNNGSDIDAGFAGTRKRGCLATGDDSKLAPLDLVTPNQLDNNYFKNLLQKKGLLQSDQVLFSGGSTDSIVSGYSRNPSTFLADFASAMVKMGDIEPLTGSAGQIRKLCSAVN